MINVLARNGWCLARLLVPMVESLQGPISAILNEHEWEGSRCKRPCSDIARAKSIPGFSTRGPSCNIYATQVVSIQVQQLAAGGSETSPARCHANLAPHARDYQEDYCRTWTAADWYTIMYRPHTVCGSVSFSWGYLQGMYPCALRKRGRAGPAGTGTRRLCRRESNVVRTLFRRLQ